MSHFLPPKHVLVVKELLFFFDESSMGCCFGGSGVSKEKLFMRMFSFFLRLCGGLCGAVMERKNKEFT